MTQRISDTIQENDLAFSALCKACGLCCTGHLFVNAEFKPVEVETAQALGFIVLQSNPEQSVSNNLAISGRVNAPPIHKSHLYVAITNVNS